ncbi:MAG: hypothetical protein M5E90_07850 [Asgard group archaeon]|nr:hypothetical protein [Asgard group archaeon]
MSTTTTPESLSIPLPKTSVIISNLNKDDFIQNGSDTLSLLIASKKLSLADQIKLLTLYYEDDMTGKITHWSNLPFLGRIVIIFKEELTAEKVYNYLSGELQKHTELSYVKPHLQENLLTRSKSNDNLIEGEHLNVKKSLDNFKSLYSSNNNDTKNDLKDYNEPKPAKVDTDLSDIPIDKDEFPSSPTITFNQSF